MSTTEFVDQGANQSQSFQVNKTNEENPHAYDIQDLHNKVHGRARAKSSQRLHRPGLTTNFI